MDNCNIVKNIREILNEDTSDLTLLVHSDLMKGLDLPFSGRDEFLASHLAELKSLHDNISIWMPAFNYDFCKGEVYSIPSTKSRVGALSEYFRSKISDWRTDVPVFSFAGFGAAPKLYHNAEIDPFGAKSIFDHLYRNEAWMMHYGSSISSSTILHYAERQSGLLSYRYDKIFKGKIQDMEGRISNVALKYHVRPLGRYLDYDWNKIEQNLVDEKILIQFRNKKTMISLCRIDLLVDYWLLRLRQDPLCLLDLKSKSWIEPLLDKLGRTFLITDFE